jgi:hypothetical protein
MVIWMVHLVDVKGAFSDRRFQSQAQQNVWFEKCYPKNCVLQLMKAINGTKQAAMQFWKKLCVQFKTLSYKRSKADPCMHFKWTNTGLVIFLSWVDDILI